MMNSSNIIWAKKPKNRDRRETLVGHTEDVVEAFKCLFGDRDKPTRLSEKWFQFFKIELERNWETFFTSGLAACVLHDIGKANNRFQNALTKNEDQLFRHEHLSGLILWNSKIKEWLRANSNLDYDLVFCSVIGHHLKADFKTYGEKLIADVYSFLLYRESIEEVLEILTHCLEYSDTPNLNGIPETCSIRKDNDFFCYDEIKVCLHRLKHSLRKDVEKAILIRTVRSALILADSVGSGVTREHYKILECVKSAFDEGLTLNGNGIDEKVIQPRIREIEENSSRPFLWHTFQDSAEELSSRALILSSCGSGKTLAAWRWIKAQANRKPISRAIFLYPTRATATEGFRDYVSWAPETDAALLHGTSEYELQDMFSNPDDTKSDKDFSINERLFALAYWQRRIFSATVDQFLGFMQHSYRSTCLLPLLADSAIVIDEAHSFDRTMFSCLRKFLDHFDVPVLCMTASLPPKRKEDLEKCGLQVFPENASQFADMQELADMPRYQILCLNSKESAQEYLESKRKENSKILWVVNTVKRCQELAIHYKEALCYHSRFILDDRKQHHDSLIRRFKTADRSITAITTQVCEMSLDLDADILVTEKAPITSLIQRMGRCNRHAKPGDGRIGTVLLYSPGESLPYKPEEYDGVDDFLNEIENKVVSQSRLEELLERFGSKEIELEKYAAFLESGPWAKSFEASLRDENDFTIPAILDCDIDKFRQYRKEKKPVDGLIVNVPRGYAHYDERLGHWPQVADSSLYDSRLGFLDKSLEIKK